MRIFEEVILALWEPKPSAGFEMGVYRQSPETHLHVEEIGTRERIAHLLALEEVCGVAWYARSPELADRLHKVLERSTKPSVRVMHLEPDPVSPVLDLDRESIGRMAAEHLLERQFPHVSICGSNETWARPYVCGFRDRVREAGRRFYHGVISSDSTSSRMEQIMAWVAEVPKPVGLATLVGKHAAFTADACKVAGYHVPGDVGPLAIGDHSPWFAMHRPSISAVAQGMEALGYRAADMIHRMAAGEEPPAGRQVVPGASIIARRSTEYERQKDPVMAAAMNYLHNTHTAHLDLSDLYENVPASRRTLERHFKQAVGRTPRQEMLRVRMRAVADLLVHTHMPLVEIAVETGQEYISHMCRGFKDIYGMTPTQYREHHTG